MTSRGMKDLRRRAWEAAQRADGRADAAAGRPPAMVDDHYARGYAEGSKECRCATVAAHAEGCDRTPVVRPYMLCRHCLSGHNDG